MKCRQYNVKVFEIGLKDKASFKDFINANLVLIKHHLILIRGTLDESTKQFLDDKGLTYVSNMELPTPKKGINEFHLTKEFDKKEEEKEETLEKETKNEIVEEIEDDNETDEIKMEPLKIIKGALRSGQYIEYNGDVLSIDRINSGAKIASMGSVIALGKVEGDISSAGECIITTPTIRGNILFHGTRIDGEKLIFPLNLIKFEGEDIIIKPINKKESK